MDGQGGRLGYHSVALWGQDGGAGVIEIAVNGKEGDKRPADAGDAAGMAG